MSVLDLRDFDALALDFDGVMAASQPVHTEARLQAFKGRAQETGDQRYIRISDEIHTEAHRHGQRSVEIIAWVLKQAGITSTIDYGAAQPIVDRKNQLYWQAAANGLPPVPGVLDFIRRVSIRTSLETGIVTTGSRTREVLPFLEAHGLGRFFYNRHIITHEDTTHTKPHPEPYDLFIDRAEVEPARVLAVEDSAQGIESAKKAGTFVVGLATTCTVEQMQELKRVAEESSAEIGRASCRERV